MFEIPLTPLRRTMLVVVLVASVATIALFVAILANAALPWKIRAVFPVGILFSAGWVVYLARILRRGAFRTKSDPRIAAVIGWLFAVATATAFALLSPHQDPFVMFCFLFLLPAAVVLLGTQIQQAELRTRERLLELEYQLARLGESLGKSAK